MKTEALSLLERRKDYYKKILLLRFKLKKIKGKKNRERTTDDYMDKIAVNENDKYFLKRIWRYILLKYWNKGGLGYFRTFLDYKEKKLVKCFENEVINPLVKPSTNESALNSINTLINNRNDCQILLDMIMEFLSADKKIDFTTMDKEDFLKKEKDIKEWFNNYFDCECFFEIIGISEAVKRVTH